MKRIGIIGAGASALMLASELKSSDATITLLEHNNLPARKLLLTGNGRCNLTNLNMDKDCFNNPEVMEEVLKKVTPKLLIEKLEKIGIYTYEKNGCVYPLSNQASSVVNIFLEDIKKNSNVRLKLNQMIGDIVPGEVYKVVTESGYAYEFDILILACGGKSYSVTGSDGSITEIVDRLAIKRTEFTPALSALKIKDETFLEACKRTRSRVGIRPEENKAYISRGELQINENNLSGIVIFDISRSFNKGGQFFVDFVPDIEFWKLQDILKEKERIYGLVNSTVAEYFLKNHSEDLAFSLKNFKVEAITCEDIEKAQVCAGGVSLSKLTKSFECEDYKNMYMVGEMLDIDGKCGGYNLHWAFSSAIIAAADIKGKL